MILKHGTPEAAGINPAKLKLVENAIEQYITAGRTHAFVILAARKGIIFDNKAFGHQSHEENSPPLALDTIFPLGSATKPMTATAAMMLYEEGKLDIHSPVVKYVPEFVGDGKSEILVCQLMTHTSGMDDQVIMKWWEKNKDKFPIPECPPDQHPNVHEFVYPGLQAPMWKKAGVQMSYCSWGISLLGEIIRRVSGQSYERFVRERLFQPLGMKDSYLIVPPNVIERIIKRPHKLDNGWLLSTVALETPRPHGGLYSTAYDMSVFLQMLLNKGSYGGVQILSPESVREMTRNQIPGITSMFFDQFFPEAGWGYCWDITYGKKTGPKLCSPEAFMHSGYGGAHIMADSHYDMLWVLFCVDYQMEKGLFIMDTLSDLLIDAVES